MSLLKCTLCQQITKDYFGDRVSSLHAFLASNGASTLKDIVVRAKIPRSRAVIDLQILLQHNFVKFDESLETKYSANLEFTIQRTRSYSIVEVAKQLYGGEVGMVLKEFVKHGRVEKEKCIDEIVSTVPVESGNLPLSAKDTPSALLILEPLTDSNFKQKLSDAFNKLDKNMLIIKIDNMCRDNDNANGNGSDNDNANGNNDNNMKCDKADKLNKGRKRILEDSDDDDGAVGDKSPSAWILHLDKLNELLRHHHICQAVSLAQGEDCKTAISTILRHSVSPTSHHLPSSPPVSFNELINIMRKESKMAGNKLADHLTNLSKYEPSFLTKCDESGGGLYKIDFKKAFRDLCVKHVCCCIEEIYGSKAKSIFNIILSSVMIEENEIEKKSRDPDSVRAVLAKLRKDQYISTMSFPKTSDYNSLNTIYVYKIDLERVARLTLERCYKAAANLIIRRSHETESNKRLLEIQTKLDVVFSQMDDDEQKDELEGTYISAAEQETLKKFTKNIDTLDAAELQVDETAFVMESYLLVNKLS